MLINPEKELKHKINGVELDEKNNASIWYTS